jgi:methylglyoxal/glyoxal reductase
MGITDLRGSFALGNRVAMPYLGLGLWKMPGGETLRLAVRHALASGYRHFDTAAAYGNEQDLGDAIRESGIPREDLFITSKVWNADQGFDRTLKAYDESLARLGMETIDLYLVHWPVKGKFVETWRALERLYGEGRVRAIGVSNFMQHHLEELLARAKQVPLVNQVEFHPYLVQQPLLDFCAGLGIQHEAWSPIMKGRVNAIPLMLSLAKKYGKTPAQVSLRWCLQKGVVAIPKSARPERISENAGIFDFTLSADDMHAIDGLDRGERVGPDPNNFDF